MSERSIVVFWPCSCPQELGDTPSVETKLTDIVEGFESENAEYVVMTGYVERCSRCKKLLGDGYGDVDFFSTESDKIEFIDKLEEIKGVWK